MLDVVAAKARLEYRPETGVFVWRDGQAAGCIAGTLDSGYLKIRYLGRQYRAHRLAWLFTYGEWPRGDIDHINGVRSDNRIANLRVVSKSENMENIRVTTTRNRSGFLGVYRKGGRFRADITVKKKTVHLGYFVTAEEAHAAYVEAKRRLHGGCTL